MKKLNMKKTIIVLFLALVSPVLADFRTFNEYHSCNLNPWDCDREEMANSVFNVPSLLINESNHFCNMNPWIESCRVEPEPENEVFLDPQTQLQDLLAQLQSLLEVIAGLENE